MKILFSATHFGFLRNFQSTIRLLAEQGHELHLLAERRDAIDGQKMADLLAADHPSITFELLPTSRHRLWYALATGVRASLDYWRYLDPRWDDAPKLRGRAAEQAPRFALAFARLPVLGTRGGLVAACSGCSALIDRALPPPGEVADVFRRINPDVLLLTPLLYFRSHQVDHVRCARQLGITSVLGVGSWDHLTTKGLIHDVPDRVLVWNEAQKQEAIELHGVPAESRRRHRRAGLRSLVRDAAVARSRRVLPAGRTRSGASDRAVSLLVAVHRAVRGWFRPALDRRDSRQRRSPRCARPACWSVRTRRTRASGRTSTSPPSSTTWRSGRGRASTRSAAPRAPTTSTRCTTPKASSASTPARMIESGIVGRPVYSVAAEEFAATQEGTLHFQHLKNVEGGLLHLARGSRRARRAARASADRRTRGASERPALHPGLRPSVRARRARHAAGGVGDRALRIGSPT